jgi:hypothetical protein
MVSSGLLRRVATRRNNPEDTILHSHRRENLKSSMSFYSANEIYRPIGPRWSAKLVPTFPCRGVSRGQRKGSPRPLISDYKTEADTFHSCNSLVILTKLSELRSSHYFSVNLVAMGIEPGTFGSVARNSDHYTTETAIEILHCCN